MSGILEDFNWELYESNYKGGNRLIPNPNIKGLDHKTRVFSHEPYAQQQFDLYNQSETRSVKKDLTKGDCVPITEISFIDKDRMTIELLGGLAVDIDLNREKRFIQIYGYQTPAEFAQVLSSPEIRRNFVSSGFYAYIIESSPSLKISLWQGHIKKTKDEFMEQISSPSKAYKCKILNANRGGYFVEVSGVEAFMPGSLAAPNKIMDFQTLVGKEVIVMVEDFLKEMNSFIVSHKKYIEHVLPQKIAELDMNKPYSGTVTGASKFGVFAEFGEIFTGLLHHSKMKEGTLAKFRSREFKPGDPIEFYIGEVTKDNRIILTEESPEEKKKKIEVFIEANKEKTIEASIAAVMNFGVIVNVGDITGIIPSKEFRLRKISTRNFITGDPIKVKFLESKDDKITFELDSPIKKYEHKENEGGA
jgi:predicted RNA-binding protein with RPS1 domain